MVDPANDRTPRATERTAEDGAVDPVNEILARVTALADANTLTTLDTVDIIDVARAIALAVAACRIDPENDKAPRAEEAARASGLATKNAASTALAIERAAANGLAIKDGASAALAIDLAVEIGLAKPAKA